LARHYRDQEHLSIPQIAERLRRSNATVRGYLYDPHTSTAKRIKESYRGVCTRCGKPTSGTGPGRSRTICGSCNGRSSAKWDKLQIERALRAWFDKYGREATSTDLSRTHATRTGGVRLQRLQEGWAEGRWPPASVVQYHYGTVKTANQTALKDPTGRVAGITRAQSH
jgi:hypothetical protein